MHNNSNHRNKKSTAHLQELMRTTQILHTEILYTKHQYSHEGPSLWAVIYNSVVLVQQNHFGLILVLILTIKSYFS